MRSRHAVALVLAVLAAPLAGAGCEPRAPEPAPAKAAREPSASGPTSSAAPSAPATSSPAAELAPSRCIKTTPSSPVRTQPPGADPRCPADPGPKPELALAAVHFPDVVENGAPLEVAVEVAKREKERERGLMYRTALAEGAGMLFVFGEERVLTFWMHNTCLPLDMIFIAEDGTIVGIEESTPTMSDETFSPGCPARYVLEVNAGWSRRHGVKAGMKVKLPPA